MGTVHTKEINIDNNKLLYSSKEFKDNGVSYFIVNKLVDEGKLARLNKRYYENMRYNGEYLDYYYINAYAKNGVVCLMSAACYYNLTNYRTDAVDIAIKHKDKISTLPENINFSIYYFNGERYTTGITEIKEGKNSFKIYNIEKTVIDIISYREKTGIEETKEILLNYLKRKDRNINTLIRYSKILKCEKVLSKYLEVLL